MLPLDQTLQQALQKVLGQAMQQAVRHHQAGQLPEAEEFYRTILQEQADHPEANHNMGVLALQVQQPAASLPYFKKALEVDQAPGHYWLGYIDALLQAGEALEARKMLELCRRNGLQGADLFELIRRLSVAIEDAPSLTHKPASSKDRRQADKNYMALRKAAPSAQEEKAMAALFGQGHRAELESRSLDLAIRYPLAAFSWKILGAAFQAVKQLAAAEASYRRALEIKPDDAEVHSNLGVTLYGQGRLDEAQACYQRAIELKPDFEAAYNNWGNTLKAQGRLSEAEASYWRALELKPDHGKGHSNLGVIAYEQNRLGEAEACYRRAITTQPDLTEAHNNLGTTLFNQGRLSEAEASYRRVLALKPDHAEAYSNRLLCLSYNAALDPAALFAEHRRFAEHFESPLRTSWPQHVNTGESHRRLQIGFVSPDLREHAIAHFIEPVLAHLADNSELSLHAYYTHPTSDSVTERLKGYLTHWHSVAHLSDDALAEKIRSDGIDILIDLSGHTAENRLLTFARKPAPLQVSWMGYPGTTGLQAMDYYFSDRFLHPAGHPIEDQFAEKIVRLPANAPFLPVANAPAVNRLPALDKGCLTFGSFNSMRKLNPETIALWSQLLCALPDSRLLIGGMGADDGSSDKLLEWFGRAGVAPERLVFQPRCDIPAYLRLHHQVDLCLDALPYGGGTTTWQALWMGVPTLTLAGQTMPSRQGLTILSHLGLTEFAAVDAASYVEKGVYWANHLAALADVRATLRTRMQQSPTGQPALIAAGLARAFRSMWQRRCSGLPAQSFEVGTPSPDECPDAVEVLV